ncbi:MAG: glycosyltransferase [Bacteroidales bacterium]|nr:glycosyltransferase [Candidatus Physcocola equi]
MKRVLMVSCGGLGNGGVQAIMMGIVRNLSNKYHFDMLVFTNEVRHYDNEFLSYGGKIFRIPLYSGCNWLMQKFGTLQKDNYTYRKLKKILKQETPYDIIHCNREMDSAPILKAAYDVGIPIRICHTHIINQEGSILRKILNKWNRKRILRYANRQIGCSEEACLALYGSNTHYSIINNFYDDNKYKTSEMSRHAESKELIISQLGAISNIKNQIFSVKVLSEILKKGFKAKLNIIGFVLEESYESKLAEYIEKNGLSEFVKWHPGDCDIPSVLASSSFFIMPSLHEGFGIALIEAQAVGLRCFASTGVPSATNCGGVIYLDLNKGPLYWANCIVQSIEANPCNIDTRVYKLSNVMQEYSLLYS